MNILPLRHREHGVIYKEARNTGEIPFLVSWSPYNFYLCALRDSVAYLA